MKSILSETKKKNSPHNLGDTTGYFYNDVALLREVPACISESSPPTTWSETKESSDHELKKKGNATMKNTN